MLANNEGGLVDVLDLCKVCTLVGERQTEVLACISVPRSVGGSEKRKKLSLGGYNRIRN
jgi:hypothetical protein